MKENFLLVVGVGGGSSWKVGSLEFIGNISWRNKVEKCSLEWGLEVWCLEVGKGVLWWI